jgi:hypothetical protein
MKKYKNMKKYEIAEHVLYQMDVGDLDEFSVRGAEAHHLRQNKERQRPTLHLECSSESKERKI